MDWQNVRLVFGVWELWMSVWESFVNCSVLRLSRRESTKVMGIYVRMYVILSRFPTTFVR